MDATPGDPAPPASSPAHDAVIAPTVACTECTATIAADELAAHLRDHFTTRLADQEAAATQRLAEADARLVALEAAASAKQVELEAAAAMSAMRVAEAQSQLALHAEEAATELRQRDEAAATTARYHETQRAALETRLRAAEREMDDARRKQAQAEAANAATTAQSLANANAAIELDFPPPTASPSPPPAISTSDMSSLSLAFFPELEPLLGGIPPVPSSHVYLAASVFLYDSFHCRTIKHEMSLRALEAYKFVHMSHWKKFMRFISWLHILLCFIEPPSSIVIDGVRYGPPHAVCGALELLCLSVYSFHAVRQWQAYGSEGYKRSPWRLFKVAVLIVCFIDVITSMARNLNTPGVHLSQLLRVFFVLEQSGRMRQLLSCILKSLPAVISIMFLCFIHIFVFGVIGFMFVGPLEEVSALNPEGQMYFSTLGRSFLSTFILLTSENFPEVMLPSYRQHWFVCIYFVVFVIIGLYGLLQLTTAVVFHSFQLHTKEKLTRAMHYRERALQATFTLISEYTCGDGFIPLDAWTKLLKQVRPDWSDTQAEILFRAATGKPDNEDSQAGVEPPRMSLSGRSTPNAVSTPSNRPRLPSLHEHHEDEDEEAQMQAAQAASARDQAAAEAEEQAVQEFESTAEMMDFLQFEQIIRFTQKSFQFAMSSSAAAAVPADSSAVDINLTHYSVQESNLSASFIRPGDVHHPSQGFFATHSRAFWAMLTWYFTFRIAIPSFVLHLMGRTEEHLAERDLEEQAARGPEGRTPLHPLLTTRTRLTTFSLCEAVADTLVSVHTILMILLMVLEDDVGMTATTLDTLRTFVLLLEVQFAFELVAKLYISRSFFFRSRLQVLDLVTILIVWVGQILVFSKSAGSAQEADSCLRLARGFRLYHRLNSFTLLLQVLGQVGPPLGALFGVLFLLLYSYSVIGMMFFCDELVLGKLSTSLDYHQSDFYVLNFNDLAHALIALFYQLVVNDWWLLMEAVVSRTNDSARIYFITFYCISVLVVFSVCTAFVVEAYMDMHQVKVETSQKGKVGPQMATLPMPTPISLAPGRAAKQSNSRDVRTPTRDLGLSRRSSVLQTSRSFRQFHRAVHQRVHSQSMSASSGSTAPLVGSGGTGSNGGSSSANASFGSSSSGNNNSPLLFAVGSGGVSSAMSIPASPVGVRPTSLDRLGALGALSRTPTRYDGGFGGGIVGSPALSTESQLLSRIRDRASTMGLRVRLKQATLGGSMIDSLKTMFHSELDDQATQDQDDDLAAEDADAAEDSDDDF